jgi:hypothetical protein
MTNLGSKGKDLEIGVARAHIKSANKESLRRELASRHAELNSLRGSTRIANAIERLSPPASPRGGRRTRKMRGRKGRKSRKSRK